MGYSDGVLNHSLVITSLLQNQTEFDLSGGKINTWIYLLINLDSKAFFFGQTKDSRKEKRHNDVEYTKLIGYWNLIGEKHTTFWFGISATGSGCDKKCHKDLKLFPNCVSNPGRGSNECFILTGYSVDQIVQTCSFIVRKLFDEVFVEPAKELNLMHFQEKFLVKIKSAWEIWKEFLLNAKCRSGKCIMTLSHIVSANYKLTLLCCRTTSPEEGWIDDQEYFPSVKLINVQDSKWEEELEFWMEHDGVNIVLWGTVQSISNRINTICNYKIDFIALDEAHVGGRAEQFTTVHEKLNAANGETVKLLLITGTADKLSPDFNNENSFVYSYWHEQLDVRKGLFEKPRPKMRIHFAKYECEEYKKIFGDDPDAMSNIFTLKEKKKGKDSEFLYDSLPRAYAVKFYGPETSRLRLNNRLFQGNYQMMAMKGVGECHAFKKIVECYIPTLVVTGDTNEDQDTINNFCARNSKALILTCSANVLGMTCKYIDTVINCRGGESKEFWEQFSFRGGSADHDWDVIDFDAERGLRVICESYQKATDIEPELAQYEMLDFVDSINDWMNGFIQLDQNKIDEILCTICDDTNSSFANIVSRLDLNDIDFSDFALETNLIDEIDNSQLNTNNVGVNNKSCESRQKENKEKSDNPETQRVKTVKALLESIPLVMTYLISEDIKVCTINSIIETEVYKNITSDHYKILEKVIAKNPSGKNAINGKILMLSSSIKMQFKESKAKTLDKYSVSSQMQRHIPTDLLDSMLDDCKDLSKIYMFGDPSGSHTARLLERDLDPNSITVWESCDSHRNRVKYINDVVDIVDSNPDMKFTAIIANPPYKDPTKKAKNNKLWPIIVEQHLELTAPGGDMCEVTPSSVLGTTGKGKKFLKLFSTKYNLKLIDYTANDYFVEGVAICRWHLTNEPYQGKTHVITHDGSFTWDLRDGLPLIGDAALKHSILNKIANSMHPRIPLKMGQDIAKSEYVPDGKYEVYQSGNFIARTNVIPTTGEVLKFIVGYSRTYKKHKFISNGYVGMLNVWCPITSEEEGNALSKIFDNKLIQFYIDNYKKTAGYTAAIKNAEVPHIKDYNNLVDQFNFTEEEVKYLEEKNVI
jgi:hypothetical protein